jgi:acetyl esterase/lipase
MSSVVLRSIASTHLDDESADRMARLDADMRHVLERWEAMGGKPIETVSATAARAAPTLIQAMRQLLREAREENGIGMEMRMIPGAAGELRARIYVPTALVGLEALPMILYFHGGGFTVGDLDDDDETPRALSKRCNAVVVAAQYRQAPEFKFPAAHEDAWAAWTWMIDNSRSLRGDPTRAALVGEEAGGNLAVNVALRARDDGGVVPKHLGLITPMAGTDFSRPSYIEDAESRPVGTATIRWFYKRILRGRNALADKRLNLLDRPDLGGLPPTTVVSAAIDPLRSEGEALADALRRHGVWVDATTYDGVTAQFFGLARIVNKAMFAQGQVIRNINESFG